MVGCFVCIAHAIGWPFVEENVGSPAHYVLWRGAVGVSLLIKVFVPVMLPFYSATGLTVLVISPELALLSSAL